MPISKLVQHISYQYRTANTPKQVRTEWTFLMKHLAPKHRGVVEFVAMFPDTSSRGVARRLGITISAASTFLKELYDLGVLERYEQKDAYGRRYLYRSSLATRIIKATKQLELPF